LDLLVLNKDGDTGPKIAGAIFGFGARGTPGKMVLKFSLGLLGFRPSPRVSFAPVLLAALSPAEMLPASAPFFKLSIIRVFFLARY
jgi:hypothetical protein